MDLDQAVGRQTDSPASGWAHRRERRSVCRALSGVPGGSAVLDVPCGSGRWLEVLVRRGYRVTCADHSEIALARAFSRWQQIRRDGAIAGPEPKFVLSPPRGTNFPDRHFDAVVCTGLFDRLDTSDQRIEILQELRRISRGPVVVSFCNAFALGALALGFKRTRSLIGSRDRIPVPVWALLNDVRRAGLKPIARHAVFWGISPLWHIVSVPTPGRTPALVTQSPARLSKAG